MESIKPDFEAELAKASGSEARKPQVRNRVYWAGRRHESVRAWFRTEYLANLQGRYCPWDIER